MEFIDIIRIVLLLAFLWYVVSPAAMSLFKQDKSGKAIGCLMIPLLLIALIVSDSIKKNAKKESKSRYYNSSSSYNYSSGYRKSNQGRYYCKDLTSSEARSLLRNGHNYLDADNDGIPCE